MSFPLSLDLVAACSTKLQLHACFGLKSTTDCLVDQFILITQKGILRSFIQYTKEQLFQNKTNKRQPEQNVFDEYVPFLRPA